MAMKRNYTTLRYKSIAENLGKNYKYFIDYGYYYWLSNRNNKRDFNLTKKLFTELAFDYSFSFIYSKRPGTPTQLIFKDDTPEELKIR